jgi:hypothetical protein
VGGDASALVETGSAPTLTQAVGPGSHGIGG